MGKVVTLQFPTFIALWRFKTLLKPAFFEMSIKTNRLTCHCSDQHIELAAIVFGAIVIDWEKESTPGSLQ